MVQAILKFAFIMSEEVGLKTQYLNWRDNFPTDINIEPTWIVVTFNRSGGLIERLPGLPLFVKTRLRAALEVRQGLRRGPFDATFVAVHSALATLPGYSKNNACFTTLDVTPKQLQEFGDFYGKYPSKLAALEQAKHRSRAANYQSYRGLFPWSNWAAKSLEYDYGVPTNNIHVLPPGVDLEQWSPSRTARLQGVCNLLFVGGHFERKGGKLLLEWAKQTKRDSWHLHIVTREQVPTVDKRITVYNNLSANDPTLTRLYQNADVFVLPTLADCYSIAGIEALACGLPVVLSLTGGTGDVVKDGITGRMLHKPNVDELELALAPLIENQQLRQSMAYAARADAEARYNVKKNIRRTVDVMSDSI